MNGLAAFVFGAGAVISLLAAYAGGLPGCLAGVVLLGAGWLLMGLGQWADPSLLAVEALTGALALWVAARWTLRHRGWLNRLRKSRSQIADERRQLDKGVLQLKEALAAKGTDFERFTDLYEVVKRMSQNHTLKALSSAMGTLITQLLGGAGWALYLADAEGKLRRTDGQGMPPDLQPHDFTSKEPDLQMFGAAWVLYIPLWRLHERVGLLAVTLPDLPLDERARVLSMASAIGIQLVVPIARAQLYQELDQACRTDELTGFCRRKPFEERVREEVARARVFQNTFSILRLELGAVGDEILRAVGQRLRDTLYDTDVIARLEGANLVCLLPQALPAGLKHKAESLRQRIESQAFVIGLEAVRVKLHMGIAHFPQDGDTSDKVLAAAERALEAAKGVGNNCVVEAANTSQW